jgi:hypothetical protein
VLANADANTYVSGIGVHWYQNFIAPPSVLTTTHEQFPDRFILATEACEGTVYHCEHYVPLFLLLLFGNLPHTLPPQSF